MDMTMRSLLPSWVHEYPSISATAPAPTMSRSYSFVNTASLLEQFMLSGYEVVAASHRRSRTGLEHTTHLVQLRNAALPKLDDGTEPRIILLNSHDGTSSLKLYFGAFRFACANGLISAALPSMQSVFAHRGRAAELVKTHSAGFIDLIPRMAERIGIMRGRRLTDDERHEFAAQALRLRFGPAPRVSTSTALQVRRDQDSGDDVWTVFNRLQENLVRGGLPFSPLPDEERRNRVTRGLRSIDSLVPLNRQLWALAERMAGLIVPANQPDRSLD